MATNGTEIGTSPRLDPSQILGSPDKASIRKRALDSRLADTEYGRFFGGGDPESGSADFALAPLVDKIAWGIARGLVVAVKELEDHIASETRKVGDTVDHRLDTFQTAFEEVTRFVGEQRGTNAVVQNQLQELTLGLRASESREAADIEALRNEARESSASVSQRIESVTATLQEADVRQAADLGALRTEAKAIASGLSHQIEDAVIAQQESAAKHAADLSSLKNETKTSVQSISERIDGLSKELGVQQEDMAAVKGMIGAFTSRVDALAERLDRQAEAVRSICSAYSQRETELEQLVDGLARLRAFPTTVPTSAL